jgi:hypothetical protein
MELVWEYFWCGIKEIGLKLFLEDLIFFPEYFLKFWKYLNSKKPLKFQKIPFNPPTPIGSDWRVNEVWYVGKEERERAKREKNKSKRRWHIKMLFARREYRYLRLNNFSLSFFAYFSSIVNGISTPLRAGSETNCNLTMCCMQRDNLICEWSSMLSHDTFDGETSV